MEITKGTNAPESYRARYAEPEALASGGYRAKTFCNSIISMADPLLLFSPCFLSDIQVALGIFVCGRLMHNVPLFSQFSCPTGKLQ